VALDERLRHELERAGRPADPTGVYEHLIRRRERRHIAHRIGIGALALAVGTGSVAGVLILSSLFGTRGDGEIEPLVPVSPAPSANGLVAFTTGKITVQAPDGSGTRGVPVPAAGDAWHVSWSPEGERLAVAIFGDAERSLWVMRDDGSDSRMIAEGANVSRASWHPDGVHLAYALEANGRTEVHVTRSDGTEDQIVYSERAPGTYAVFSATFSPDGSKIVFDAGTEDGYDIFVMDADGSDVQRITRTGSDYNPSWSPDGSQIVFTRQEAASESDIFLMDADGSDVRRLTDDDGSFTNLDPAFSPDGTMITYEAAKNGGVGPIVVMNADGTEARTFVRGAVLGFSWQPIPEGGTVAPSPSPTGGTGPSGSGRSVDLGLGFPVCNVSSIDAAFVAPDVNSTVFVATRRGDAGGCPQPDEAFNVIALDADGDRIADSSFGPIECTSDCRAFSAPDVDGDGTSELLLVQEGGAVIGLRLYDVISDGVQHQILPVVVASPGDPEGGFEPSQQASFLLGGDAFELYGLQCGDVAAPAGPGIVATSAESLPHDSPNAEWHAHQTALMLRTDGLLHVVDIREFREPFSAGPEGPSFLSGETLCGSNLGP
jgi:hypothetical protein